MAGRWPFQRSIGTRIAFLVYDSHQIFEFTPIVVRESAVQETERETFRYDRPG